MDDQTLAGHTPVDLTLADLVRNGTMSPEIAATLATAGAQRRSFVTIAIPRLAGKTTVMRAILAHAPRGTAVQQVTKEAGPGLGIPAQAGGYLVLAEIAPVPFADYLWGAPVRLVFAALDRGFALATALHAPGVEEAFEVICGENAVPDAHAAHLDLAVYIRTLGRNWQRPTGRRVAAVHEIEGVEHGRPRTRLLHRWDETRDAFESVEPPRRLLLDEAHEAHEARLARFRAVREGDEGDEGDEGRGYQPGSPGGE